MADGGAKAEVEIEDDEAVITNGENAGVTLYGGAKPKHTSSLGFVAKGADHGEFNEAGNGSEGIPMGSDKSVFVHSSHITTEGYLAGTKAAKTKDNPKGEAAKAAPERILKAAAKAEANPNDRFANNPESMKMNQEELAYLEQKSEEGKYLKGARDILKSKDPNMFARFRDYVVNNSNDGKGIMEGQAAMQQDVNPEGLAQSGEPTESPAMPNMQQPIPNMQQPVPLGRYGGRSNYPWGGKIKKKKYPCPDDKKPYMNFMRPSKAPVRDFTYSQFKDDGFNTAPISGFNANPSTYNPSNISEAFQQTDPMSPQSTMYGNVARYGGRSNYQVGGSADPSRMTPQQRHEYNMNNNIYQMGGAVPPEMMGPPMEAESGLPPELQAAQGQGMDPMQEAMMTQGAAQGAPPMESGIEQMPQEGGLEMGMAMAQEIMQILPNILKPMTPEEMQSNPNDIFTEGFEKELQNMGMSIEEIKDITISELAEGQVGQILGGMLQDATPATAQDNAAMEQMPQEGQVPPEMMQQQAMAEMQQMMYGGRSLAQNSGLTPNQTRDTFAQLQRSADISPTTNQPELLRYGKRTMAQNSDKLEKFKLNEEMEDLVRRSARDRINPPYRSNYLFDTHTMSKSDDYNDAAINAIKEENAWGEAKDLENYLSKQKTSGQPLRFINKLPVNINTQDENWQKSAIENAVTEQNNKSAAIVLKERRRDPGTPINAPAYLEPGEKYLMHGGRNDQGYPDWKFQRSRYMNDSWRPKFQDSGKYDTDEEPWYPIERPDIGEDAWYRGESTIIPSMAHQRKEKKIPSGVPVTTEQIDPSYKNFVEAVPEATTEPYSGYLGDTYQSRFSELETEIAPSEKAEERTVDVEDIRTEGKAESFQSQGAKGPKSEASGRSLVLSEEIPNLYEEEGYFKGKGADDAGSYKTSILTKKGHDFFTSKGITDLETTTWENIDSSDLWESYLGNDFKSKYETAANKQFTEGSIAESALDPTRKDQAPTMSDQVFNDLNTIHDKAKGRSYNRGSKADKFLNDIVADGGVTKEMLRDNPKRAKSIIDSYLTHSEFKGGYKNYYDKLGLRGTPLPGGKTSFYKHEKEQEVGDKPLEVVKETPGVYGKAYTFKQAFRDAYNKGIGIFWWGEPGKEKPYLAKRGSELTPEEKAALKRGLPAYKDPKPWETPPDDSKEPGTGPGAEVTRTREGDAYYSTGDLVTPPKSSTTTTFKGNLSTKPKKSRLVPIRPNKELGGRTGLTNGQYIKFEHGGVVHEGYIDELDRRGNFKLR